MYQPPYGSGQVPSDLQSHLPFCRRSGPGPLLLHLLLACSVPASANFSRSAHPAVPPPLNPPHLHPSSPSRYPPPASSAPHPGPSPPPPKKNPRPSRHKHRHPLEQPPHLLQRHPLRLRQKRPEEECVRHVPDHERDVVPPPNTLQHDGRDLPDHGVERKGRHRGERDALGARVRVEHFGGDDPAKGPHRRAEAVVVEPRHGDEAPVRRSGVRGPGGTAPGGPWRR
ncbi:hypothetical protein VUR80DRAFT_6550 [Thermomyces stellatus]